MDLFSVGIEQAKLVTERGAPLKNCLYQWTAGAPGPDAYKSGSSEDVDVAEVDSGLKRKRATNDDGAGPSKRVRHVSLGLSTSTEEETGWSPTVTVEATAIPLRGDAAVQFPTPIFPLTLWTFSKGGVGIQLPRRLMGNAPVVKLYGGVGMDGFMRSMPRWWTAG
ncbi:hypothetical protein Tco_0990301 [Tanacetum coccineum]|uniref:Uncharacterized protein n=1 Tax=Tanacetum coccineum TaxID=301880 RepID=A0ABQ5EWF8_9ASTR